MGSEDIFSRVECGDIRDGSCAVTLAQRAKSASVKD